MDDTRLHEQRDTLAHRVLHEWLAANARQQSRPHQIIDWLDERAHDTGDETVYDATQRLLDLLGLLGDDQQHATTARCIGSARGARQDEIASVRQRLSAVAGCASMRASRP